MYRHRLTVWAAAAAAAGLCLSGCVSDTQAREPAAPSSSSSVKRAAAPQPAGLPAPEAIADVLYRLSDPGVPGTEKLNLIQGVTAADAPALDKFANALRDNGYLPLDLTAGDIAWAETEPANVVATITVTKPGSPTGFSMPMEFRPYQNGWQLTEETFDMLVNLGKASTSTTAR
jgi:hypothetical protein